MIRDRPARPEPAQSGAPAELRERNERLEVLYTTIRDLTSTLAVHEVIERLLDRILLYLDAEIGSILLVDSEGQLQIVHSRGLPGDVVSETRIRSSQGISGHVLETGRSLLVADVEVDERFRRRNHERYFTHSFISAPLVIEGEVRGVINVNNKSSHEAFADSDLKLLEAIAGHAAVALSNARRFEEMIERARQDPLTGIANHGHFWSCLDLEIERSRRHERPLAVVLIDIDHFKAYNDCHGHLEGDKALVAVALIITGCSRVNDIVARYGGEEFAVILPETPHEGAVAFAEKVRETIEASDFSLAEGPGITLSAGVASFGEDGASPAELVRAADRELYRAKELGRNRVCSTSRSE
jgi:diguanylate cyclase (GGDEF)-like protein